MGLFGKSKLEKELETKVAELEANIKERETKITELEGMLLPEQQNIIALKKEIAELEEAKVLIETKLGEFNIKAESALSQFEEKVEALKSEISEKQSQIIQLDDEILYQSFGLYKPLYDFASSTDYKLRLDSIREKQKKMIKDDHAVSYSKTWTVDGSKAKGAKMTKDNVKLVLRCFNLECENAIDRVKFNNVESMRNRIQKSYDTLNKLNEVNAVAITPMFLNLKLEELNLAMEYALKKQEEKEDQKRIREELREQQKLEKEIRAAREKLEKDRKHFTKAIKDLESRLSSADAAEKEVLTAKLAELQGEVDKLDSEEKTIDYREQNAKAGYVYIISNIGAFGENIYKIGMTRRLEPMERIDELGDASVPFDFDVHALIFSEDAPALETALHKAFEDKKVNMVNTRREFFNVSLDEIKKVVQENYDKTTEFIDIAEAEQYRMSQKMRDELVGAKS